MASGEHGFMCLHHRVDEIFLTAIGMHDGVLLAAEKDNLPGPTCDCGIATRPEAGVHDGHDFGLRPENQRTEHKWKSALVVGADVVDRVCP